MSNFFYRCTECGREYAILPDRMCCPHCSEKQSFNKPLRGILEVIMGGRISNPEDLFAFLPVEKTHFPPVPLDFTPLWQSSRLKEKTGFSHLYMKDETRQLTGSLKDRASLLVAAFARREGIKEITVASTGNAGSSMAGIGAAAGLQITLFLPESAPKAKIVQALQYGARVIPVKGTYDQAFDLSLAYSKKRDSLSRNTAYNPLTIEGKKTVSLEIFYQLKDIPDVIFVPVGDGVILSGIYKGFRDLKDQHCTNSIPHVVAVQAEGSSAIARAFHTGKFTLSPAKTLADSISVSVPRGGYYALKQLKTYHGSVITVSDNEILHAQKELSTTTGLFAEPAAAASYAGFLKIKGTLSKDQKIVLLITGNGLKDIDTARKSIHFPKNSISSLEDLDHD